MTAGSNKTNVRAIARQLVLSSFGGSVQSRDVFSDGSTQPVGEQKDSAKPNWEQKNYKLSFTVQLEEISVDGDKHVYQISLNDDANLSMLPISKRSKSATGQAVTVPQKKSKSKKVAVVYGIQQDGKLSLPHTSGLKSLTGIADFYSWLLGQIDDAIQFRLQQQKNQKTDDDAGKRDESPQPQEDVGKHKKAGRGKKVRAEVLPEALPEEAAVLVENDGPVLGNGYANIVNQLGVDAMDTFDGTGLEGVTLEF